LSDDTTAIKLKGSDDMREKISVTFSDASIDEEYITPGSFHPAAMSYCFQLEDSSQVWLQRLQVRMIVISEEE
jgi:hypothetical protein